jgi:hypothetical protein
VFFPIKIGAGPNLIEPVGLRQELIVRHFVYYPQKDQNAAGYTYCQSGDVYKRVESVLKEIAESNDEVIPEHGFSKFNWDTPHLVNGFMYRVVFLRLRKKRKVAAMLKIAAVGGRMNVRRSETDFVNNARWWERSFTISL